MQVGQTIGAMKHWFLTRVICCRRVSDRSLSDCSKPILYMAKRRITEITPYDSHKSKISAKFQRSHPQ